MTMPNGPAGANPDATYVVGSSGLSDLAARTRTNITAELQAAKYPGSIMPKWAGKKVSPGSVAGMDASKITTGTFGDYMVPDLGLLRDAIYQGFTGTSSTGRTAAQVKAAIEDAFDGVLVGISDSGAVVGELRDAIYQAAAGGALTDRTAAQVKTALVAKFVAQDDINDDFESRIAALETP